MRGARFCLERLRHRALSYFYYHGDHSYLVRARDAYLKATVLNPVDARPWFNLQYVYSWTNESEKQDGYTRAHQLAPTWPFVTFEWAKARVDELSQELDKLKEEQNPQAELERIEQIKLKLKKARSDLKSEQEGPVPVPAEPGTMEAAGGSPPELKSGQEAPVPVPAEPGTEAPTEAWKLIQAAEKVRKLESQLEKA